MACLKTALWILWVFTNLQNSSRVHSLTSPLITIKEKNIPFGLLKALTQESPWVKVGSVCSKRGLGVQGQRPAGCSAHKVAGPLEKISQSISLNLLRWFSLILWNMTEKEDKCTWFRNRRVYKTFTRFDETVPLGSQASNYSGPSLQRNGNIEKAPACGSSGRQV